MAGRATKLLIAACLLVGGCERQSSLYLEPGKKAAPARSAKPVPPQEELKPAEPPPATNTR